MRRWLAAVCLLATGFGFAQIAASAPNASFCIRNPGHWKCATVPTGTSPPPTTAPPPTTTTTAPPTTAPPPITTTSPPPTTTAPPTQTGVANVWIAPPT